MEFPESYVLILEGTEEATESNFLPNAGISSIMILSRNKSTSA